MGAWRDFAAEWANHAWAPLSRAALCGWTAFYVLFMVYALAEKSGFLFIDQANLLVHEAGHLLFGWFGATCGLWGGTLFELIVPFVLALYFAARRQTAAVAFCAFFFFENFLYIATYMSDARAQALPLVTVGDPENGEHDWFHIFSQLGLLEHDIAIARGVRVLGWLGMLGSAGWLVLRSSALSFRRRGAQGAGSASGHRSLNTL